MDEPVTDIKFVNSADHCPEGYNIITNCPCGHDAQLWEKVIGGESGKRYLCFTRDKKKDTVIEDLYIPSKSEQYLRRGYVIIKATEEGSSPMYHRQLAIKIVPRSEAKKAVADIIVARSKDKISTIYKKTEKVNGLCICYRIMDYTYTLPPTLAARRSTLASGEKVQKRFEQVLDYGPGSADGGRDLGKKFEGMRVYDDNKGIARPRAGSDGMAKGHQFKVNLDTYAPSPPESPSVIDHDPLPPYTEVYPPIQGQETYKVNLMDYNPTPVFTAKSVSHIETDSTGIGGTDLPPKYSEIPPTAPPTSTYVGEVATATVSYSLGSAPPPPASSSQAPPTSSQAPPPTTTASATTFNYQPSPSSMQSTYPPPQPPQQQYQSYPTTAPPAGGGYQPYTAVQSGAYQPQPSRYPPPTAPATISGGAVAPPPSYNTNIGFQMGGVMGGASYPPPPQPGYQSVGANAFGQSGFSSVSGGPAPYNPFHHQPAMGGVNVYPPPPAAASQQGTQQQDQSSATGYGFKF